MKGEAEICNMNKKRSASFGDIADAVENRTWYDDVVQGKEEFSEKLKNLQLQIANLEIEEAMMKAKAASKDKFNAGKEKAKTAQRKLRGFVTGDEVCLLV